MWLFKKKPQDAAPAQRPSPTAMQSMQEPAPLKQEPFLSPEPRNAMIGAVREGVTQPRQAVQQQDFQQPAFPVPEPPAQQPQQTDYDFPVEQPVQQPTQDWEPAMPEMGEVPVALSSTPTTTEIEEVVEAVVEEKWKQLEFRIDTVEKRFDAVNERLHDIDLQMRTIKESGNVASGGIEGKLDQYHDNLDQIDARIGSIEKAFKETLPSMIESVRSVNESLQKMGNK